MSRIHTDLSGNVTKTIGEDHAVGRFVQLTDKRYAGTPEDIQGEGFVLDWDELFGFNVNLINAEVKDLSNNTKLLVLCDDFAHQLAK
jgi:hypothetical protein